MFLYSNKFEELICELYIGQNDRILFISMKANRVCYMIFFIAKLNVSIRFVFFCKEANDMFTFLEEEKSFTYKLPLILSCFVVIFTYSNNFLSLLDSSLIITNTNIVHLSKREMLH